MADMERMHFTDRLPPERNWRSEKATKQAMKVAENIGKWGKLAVYPNDDRGRSAAQQRAWNTPKSAAWSVVGRFEAKVRYDVWEDQLVVWIRCVKRNKDGKELISGTPSTD